MAGFNLDTWHDFFAAQAAAGAALAGLVFVAISINLERVVASRAISRRALEAVALLASLLIIGLLALIPEQGGMALGIEYVILGAVLAVVLIRISSGANVGDVSLGKHLGRVVLGQLAALPVIIGGISLVTNDGGGLYWIAFAAIAAIIAGLAGAWVLLIEILR